jgi:tight adherence protein B
MARRRAGWHRAAEVEVMIAAAAELRAGRLPKDALRAAAAALASDAAAGSPEARPSWGAARRLVGAGGVAAATAAIGTRVARAAAEEDVPAALRRPHDIGGGMQRLASCWEVALSTGSELAPVLERVAAGLRSDEALRRRTHAELAGPRSTAYLLSTLPVVTLLLGAAAGARPTAFLTTPPGLAVALAGLVFLAAGIAWSRALARTAVSRLDPP